MTDDGEVDRRRYPALQGDAYRMLALNGAIGGHVRQADRLLAGRQPADGDRAVRGNQGTEHVKEGDAVAVPVHAAPAGPDADLQLPIRRRHRITARDGEGGPRRPRRRDRDRQRPLPLDLAVRRHAAQIHLVLAWSYVVDEDGGRCPDALDSAAVEHDDVSVRVKVDAGREAGDFEGAGRPGGVVAIAGEDCKREQQGAEPVSRAAEGHR